MKDFSDGKINLIFGDALELKKSWLPSSWTESSGNPKKLQIIGNLPYAIATPLTLNLIKEFISLQNGIFKTFSEVEMIFMFQKEVARVRKILSDLFLIFLKKFSAKVGTREYGRLAVMAQAFCDVSYSFSIDSTKFTPKPKVDSGLVKFRFKSSKFIKSLNASEKLFLDLESLSGKLFRHKNKKLGSVDLPWAELGIDSNLRPHHLSPENFIGVIKFYEFSRPKVME